MEHGDGPEGWSVLSETDSATALIDAALSLDPEECYTTGELADAAGLSMKDLYLSDAVSVLTDRGLFETVDDDGETAYTVVEDGDIYEAAVAFAEAVEE